ncbi:hypothetical protein E8E12_001449 [Didymella heteroderae]|uniref:Uncharacterized protein n=1 Tax=Didymella heteroderae TaxID=1769908 RepID=A0A9P5BZF3_9PLEO|nr:hypothetical protein E8E12_001449 [Didymella heteroderae]
MWKVCALELPSVLILPELPLPVLKVFDITGFTQCTQIETLNLDMDPSTFRDFVDRADLVPESRFGRHWCRVSETFWGLKRIVFLRGTILEAVDAEDIREHLNMPDLVVDLA